jgi:hypothetical protein
MSMDLQRRVLGNKSFSQRINHQLLPHVIVVGFREERHYALSCSTNIMCTDMIPRLVVFFLPYLPSLLLVTIN